MGRLEEIKKQVEQAPDALEVVIGWADAGIAEYCMASESQREWDKINPDMLTSLVKDDLPYLLERIEHLEREIEEKDNYIADLEDEIENKV